MSTLKTFLGRKTLLAGGMLVVATALVAGMTGAFFSDTETSPGNVFQAGTLDLEVGIASSSTIGNLSPVSLEGNEALFNFQGLLPGESDHGAFILDSNINAWVCAAAEVVGTPEHDRYDPEEIAGDMTAGENEGELQDHMQLALWVDTNGDGAYGEVDTELQVFDIAEFDASWLSVMDSNNTEGEYLAGDVSGNVGFQYCFGEFVDVSNPAAGCDGSGSNLNQAQSDGVEMVLKFIGMQHANNPLFACSDLNVVEEVGD